MSPGGAAAEPRAARPGAGAALLLAAAALLAAGALGRTLAQGVTGPRTALAFGALIAAGELLRCGPDRRGPAPLAAAGAVGYAFLGPASGDPGGPEGPGVLQTVAVVLVAGLAGLAGPAGAVLSARSGDGGRGGRAAGEARAAKAAKAAGEARHARDRLARRVLTAGFAACCVQPLSHPEALPVWTGSGPGRALYLLLAAVLTAQCDTALRAVFARSRRESPSGPRFRDEPRARVGPAAAVCGTGALLAPAVDVAGLWALPAFCLPLLPALYAYRRYEDVRATCRQTIASLARATEIAGCVPVGHARRVAVLSRDVGRELGLSGPELDVVEYAALLHDVGRLSLPDPAPGGAGELPAEDRRRIARLGGAVVRQTGVPPEVAVVVERQADPCPEQPLPTRIIRAVDAYDDLTDGAGRPAGAEALDRLRRDDGEEYEPRVVDALARVLSRGAAGS
ncbi:HD domain-containing protein [Streptomyces xinghaiensis]|uniref:HD domain-containing protein n=3 Tax=Streptomyces TaxID=1883 RepID=A0A3M8FBS9_9ACTN|nr:HD domain-containing protein [Streptomyces xinghaiensis]PQM24209.1 HD domain-containing protein [Streptomyces xinghaiensis]RKM97173.1 HD domain-containing protein [Streptomyces xinghaiensis]RNC75433.1 HD domain-containing protein [Streptomyces xinghaiensis]